MYVSRGKDYIFSNSRHTQKKSFISYTSLAMQQSSPQSLLRDNLQSFTCDPSTFNPRGRVAAVEL